MNKQNAIPTKRSLPKAIERIAKLESEMNKKFLERDRFSARLIDALIMGQHILAVGPPGTSKSDQCLAVADAIKELDEEKSRKGIAEHKSIKAWKYQFQPFTTLSEVFGAFSIVGMKEDRYSRYSANRLPDCKLAVMEEFFKSNSATLNGLLGALNERHWFDEGVIKKMPLRTAVLNSNRLPSDSDELEAVEDRICLRVFVGDVKSEENFDAIMCADSKEENNRGLDCEVFEADLDVIRKSALRLEFSEKATESRAQIRREINSAGIYVSVRRWKMASRIAKCFAVRTGSSVVEPRHLSVFEDCLWNRIEEMEQVQAIVSRLASPWKEDINDLNALLAEAFNELREIERGQCDASNVVRVAKKVQMAQATAKEIDAPEAGPEVEKVLQFAATCRAQAMAMVERSMA